MADTTETKTYIIKIQSDLDKYTKEAIAAKKATEDTKKAVDDLKTGQFKSREEIEKVNAAHRNAKKEYTDLTKLIDLANKALKAEGGSYEQLLRVHRLNEVALKTASGTMKRNEDGTYSLTAKYIQLAKEVDNSKRGLDAFGKGISDNRLNVGNYGQAIDSAFKDAGSKIMSMVGPMALVGAAIGVATKLWDGLKDAVMSTTFAIDIMNKSVAVSKQLFYDLAINGKISLETLIQASKIQGELNALRIRDSVEALQISKINREQQAIREIAIDRTKTHEERLAAFIKVRDMESQKTKIQVDNLKDELKAKEELFRIQPSETVMLRILELRTQINDTYAAEDTAMRRVMGQLTGLEQEKIDLRKKGYDAWMAEIDATNKANEDAKNLRKANKEEEDGKNKEFAASELARLDREAEVKWNKEVEFQRQLFDFNRAAGQAEYDARIAEEEALAAAELEIHETLSNAKMNLANSVANFLGAIAGKNKGLQIAALMAEKALAIADIIIKTTQANAALRLASELSTLPGPFYLLRLAKNKLAATAIINLNRAAAALDIAAIIAAASMQAKSISQSGGSSGGGGSAPTAISGSAPVQRTYAQSAGSSILTQTQLTQPQLNAIPNQNMLTAADIAAALKNLPTPVVTVEDINAKVKSKAKVEVRANI